MLKDGRDRVDEQLIKVTVSSSLSASSSSPPGEFGRPRGAAPGFGLQPLLGATARPLQPPWSATAPCTSTILAATRCARLGPCLGALIFHLTVPPRSEGTVLRTL